NHQCWKPLFRHVKGSRRCEGLDPISSLLEYLPDEVTSFRYAIYNEDEWTHTIAPIGTTQQQVWNVGYGTGTGNLSKRARLGRKSRSFLDRYTFADIATLNTARLDGCSCARLRGGGNATIRLGTVASVCSCSLTLNDDQIKRKLILK